MKKILKKILTFFAVFLAFLPSLALAQNNYSLDSLPSKSQKMSGLGIKTNIAVVRQENYSKGLAFNSQIIKIESCDFLKSTNLNLVQDQALVNLNQPVDCFNLVYGQATRVAENLEVKPLARIEQKIITLNSLNFDSGHYRLPAHFPLKEPASVIPFIAFSPIFTGAGFIFKTNKKISELSRTKQALSLEKLQMLRC